MNDKLESNHIDKQARITENRERMITKWRGELDIIGKHVIVLHHSRSIYNRLGKIIDQNPSIQKSNALYDWLQRNYAESAAMAIRRLLDDDRRAISLALLVESMTKNANLISREWFETIYEKRRISRYPQINRKIANDYFDELVGAKNSSLSSENLGRMLKGIRSLSEPVLDFSNKVLAHRDKNPPDKLPTFVDLDKAIDAIGDLFKYLNRLINQSSLDNLTYTESFRWESLFEEPWIVDNLMVHHERRIEKVNK